MSMFSIPDELMPDAKQLEQMSRDVNAVLPTELASAVNLMAHPAAGVAAASALGFGMASQMIGMWMGAMAGAAEASGRFLVSIETKDREAAIAPRSKTSATRARAATKTLIADAQQTARDVIETSANLADAELEAGKALAGTAPDTAKDATVELLPEDFVQPRAVDKPARPDDLKAISGVGPKLEAVLNGLGIWTYSQIAAWEPREIAWVDDYLSFKGRIDRDGWIEQASMLAAGRK